MKCFYHSEKDAVALCKSCNRALCIDCVADVPPGVACKGRCENDVSAVNLVIEHSKIAVQKAGTVYRHAGTVHRVTAIVQLVLGLFFVLLGILPVLMGHGYGLLFAAFVGVVFLLWSFFSYRSGAQISTLAKRSEPSPSDSAGERPRG